MKSKNNNRNLGKEVALKVITKFQTTQGESHPRRPSINLTDM